ncbi:MAG: UbiA family prenyltransferase [Candidatus Thermoplasmatota archaeon]|jgi:4-hydroxybenzoate polyprenyltransferase|nr:UbiA family prenyltransferase [Candidatus Thermoplasmatota archaeon]
MLNLVKNKHIKGYIDLVRPFTLIAPIFVSSCIMIASYFQNSISLDLFHVFLVTVIPASFSLAILNAASNALNQATDVEVDKISKPYRPIVRGDVSLKQAKIISFILYITAFLLSMTINFTFTFMVFLITMFTISYSLPPRVKDKLFLNQIWIAIPRGFFGILASWSVFGNPLEKIPLTISFIVMTFLIGGSITKDIIDCEADKKTGTKTLINTYGLKKAAIMVLPLMILPFAYIPILINIGLLDSYLWVLSFLAIPAYFVFHFMLKDKKTSRIFENTPSWILMYCTYLLFALGFSLLTVINSIY